LWGLTALFLASKYDEIDKNIPYIKEFGQVSSRAKYSYSEVIKCENKFLNLLNWELMVLTPMYFLTALLSFGVVFDDDVFKLSSSTPKNLESIGECIQILNGKVKSVKKFAVFFVDIGIQSLEIQKHKFSVQAVASVVAARKVLHIEPLWNDQLEQISGLKFKDVEE
jgi:hypothetical protein